MSLQQADVANCLLARLSPGDFDALAPRLERATCPRPMVLAEPSEPMPYAYFLEKGAASIIATSRDGQQAEAGLIGRKGFVHPALALGSDRTPQLIHMQMAGGGHRIVYGAFVEAVAESATLRSVLLLFAQVLNVQSSYTSLANAVHPVDERLARWLLMCHDRFSVDDLPLTHGFMLTMLSVWRPSVTTATTCLPATASSAPIAASSPFATGLPWRSAPATPTGGRKPSTGACSTRDERGQSRVAVDPISREGACGARQPP